MTELITTGPVRRRAGVGRMKRHALKTDMTPMADLGFLLITFFVITAELSKPRTTPLYMPADGDATLAAESKSLTIITGANNKIYYYPGTQEAAERTNTFYETGWSESNGIGKIIREKQAQLDLAGIDRNELVILIKPGNTSSYKNAVEVLDEMAIHLVTRYAILKPSAWEKKQLEIRQ
jgi:biopolymer transport protein ExbD